MNILESYFFNFFSFYTLFCFILFFFFTLSASLVIFADSMIYSLLYLIFTFLFGGVIIFLLKSEFLALVVVIIYIGALIMLFLFVIMMLDLKNLKYVKPVLNIEIFSVLAACGSILGFIFYPIVKHNCFKGVGLQHLGVDYRVFNPQWMENYIEFSRSWIQIKALLEILWTNMIWDIKKEGRIKFLEKFPIDEHGSNVCDETAEYWKSILGHEENTAWVEELIMREYAKHEFMRFQNTENVWWDKHLEFLYQYDRMVWGKTLTLQMEELHDFNPYSVLFALNDIDHIGFTLYTTHFLYIILISLMFIVAIIGSVVLTSGYFVRKSR